MKQETIQSLPLPTVRRLPLYLSLLQEAQKEGLEHISSALIARRLDFEPIQVRKDLAGCGAPGQPRVGFAVSDLITAIQMVLGWNNTQDALLVGAGHLGSALAGYNGFGSWGLRIAALFDVADSVVGKKIHGKTVFHLDKMPTLIKRMHVQIGILTVPAESAQIVAELMVDSGIKALWNFAGPKLQLPAEIVVERVDLAASLAVLSSKLVGTHR